MRCCFFLQNTDKTDPSEVFRLEIHAVFGLGLNSPLKVQYCNATGSNPRCFNASLQRDLQIFLTQCNATKDHPPSSPSFEPHWPRFMSRHVVAPWAPAPALEPAPASTSRRMMPCGASSRRTCPGRRSCSAVLSGAFGRIFAILEERFEAPALHQESDLSSTLESEACCRR